MSGDLFIYCTFNRKFFLYPFDSIDCYGNFF